MKRMSDPAKKKHSNKPRPAAIEPLADDERLERARQEWSKGLLHLQEADDMARLRIAPNSCIHSAYYAMHHVAASVILVSGGVGRTKSSPASHTHVIEHFAKLVAVEGVDMVECGRMLSRAHTDRTTADYGLVMSADIGDAIATTEDARRFVDRCRDRWGLDRI